jgi:hypothetical protein
MLTFKIVKHLNIQHEFICLCKLCYVKLNGNSKYDDVVIDVDADDDDLY